MASTWTAVDALDDELQQGVAGLLASIEHREGDEALTEDQQDRLDRGDDVQHLIRRDTDGTVSGYAVVAPGSVLLAEPALGTLDDALVELLEALEQPVSLLLRGVDNARTVDLEARGWVPSRALRRMRRALPADPPPATDVEIRTFRPGLDDAAWVEQNNAAFKGHPTQSNMTVERLRRRYAAAWFDPEGFLLLELDGRLLASCWTKVHRCESGDVGEIYVISVAPEGQGRGLGRVAVLAGLEFLAGQGLATAELFVEDDNVPAIALYEALGFKQVARIVEFHHEPGSAQPAPTARPTA